MKFHLIESAGLTQQEFADIIGISRVGLNKIINNGTLDKIERGLTMLEGLVGAHKLPRGYSRTDKVARAALTTKLKTRFEVLAP